MEKQRRPGDRIAVKRVYSQAEESDGFRILVDRIWPRGLSKEKAGVDLWLKDVAPSTELRRWFGHAPERWGAFQAKYREELRSRTEALDTLRRAAKQGKVTLLFAAKDESRNNAVVLKEVLDHS